MPDNTQFPRHKDNVLTSVAFIGMALAIIVVLTLMAVGRDDQTQVAQSPGPLPTANSLQTKDAAPSATVNSLQTQGSHPAQAQR
jgi:hypothetical protein